MSLTLNLVIACLFVGTALSADHCCLNNKFFGKGLIVSATLQNGSTSPTMTQSSFWFDYDVDKKMQRVNGSVLVETSAGQLLTSFEEIRDYNHARRYTLNETHCKIDPLTEQMQDTCVPKNFTSYGTFRFGAGNETALVNGWVGQIGNEAWTMTTTVNDCTVVSYTRLGTQPDGSKVSETAQFADIVQGSVSVSTVFDIPTHCKPAAAAVGVGK